MMMATVCFIEACAAHRRCLFDFMLSLSPLVIVVRKRLVIAVGSHRYDGFTSRALRCPSKQRREKKRDKASAVAENNI